MTLLRDTWLLFSYRLRTTLRNPIWVLMGLFQPVVWMLLFAPLLDRIAAGPGFPTGGALAVFTPGILVMLALYSSLFVGFGLVAELRAGVLERLAVTPASRLALVLGRVFCDVVVLVMQSVLLLSAAWLLGLRADPLGVAVALGLVALIGLLMASCSYALALRLRDENALAAMLNFFTLPLLLLSGILLPLTLAPEWMQVVAVVNPFFHAVEAARALFRGALNDASVARGFLSVVLLAALGLGWAARSFRRVAA